MSNNTEKLSKVIALVSQKGGVSRSEEHTSELQSQR